MKRFSDYVTRKGTRKGTIRKAVFGRYRICKRDAAAHRIFEFAVTEEKQQAIGIPPGILPPFAYWIGFEIHDPGIWEMVLQSDFPVFTIEITGNAEQG